MTEKMYSEPVHRARFCDECHNLAVDKNTTRAGTGFQDIIFSEKAANSTLSVKRVVSPQPVVL